MKKQAKPEYRKKDAVNVDLSEEHFKHLRKAYLEGQLRVDSKVLAEKMMAFEKGLLERIAREEEKNGKPKE